MTLKFYFRRMNLRDAKWFTINHPTYFTILNIPNIVTMLNVNHRSVTDHHECQQNARTQQVLLINILKLRQQVVLIPKSELLFISVIHTYIFFCLNCETGYFSLQRITNVKCVVVESFNS